MHLSEQLNKKNKKNLFFKHSILIKLFPCQNRNKQKQILGDCWRNQVFPEILY